MRKNILEQKIVKYHHFWPLKPWFFVLKDFFLNKKLTFFYVYFFKTHWNFLKKNKKIFRSIIPPLKMEFSDTCLLRGEQFSLPNTCNLVFHPQWPVRHFVEVFRWNNPTNYHIIVISTWFKHKKLGSPPEHACTYHLDISKNCTIYKSTIYKWYYV